MKMLRRRVRRSFLLAAVGFLVYGITLATHQDFAASGTTAFDHYGNILLYLAQGALYLVAFLATRTPSPYRSNAACGASLVTLIYSGCDLWQHHADIFDARRGLIFLIIAAAGLYVFGQGGSPATPEAEASAGPAIAQPTTAARLDAAIANQSLLVYSATVPPGERIMRVYKIPAERPKAPGDILVTPEPSASSPAIAAAAASPQAPATPSWDPLSLIRDNRSKA